MRRFFRLILLTFFLFVMSFFTVFLSISQANDSTYEINRELCDDNLQFSVPDFFTGSFSIAIRTKIFEPGKEKGNDGEYGMLLNVGNGWDNGFRIIYCWKSGEYSFQIGRQGGSRIVTSQNGRCVGVMRDVVATYDAASRKMIIYVDGVRGQENVFDDSLSINTSVLNIGFGGFGVGSCRMFVDKVEYWSRALSADEISEREKMRDEKELSAIKVFDRVSNILLSSNDVSSNDLRWALELDLTDGMRSKLNEALCERLLEEGRVEEVAPIVFEAARSLASNNNQKANERPTLDDLQSFGAISARLTKLKLEISRINNEAARQDLEQKIEAAQHNLNSARQQEDVVFEKIDKLLDSAERVRQLEPKALDRFENVRDSFKTDKATYLEVATNGSDESGDGSSAKPYASLARAFEEVQKSAKDGERFIVRIDEGLYRVSRKATLENVSNVLVEPRGNVILSGGVEIDDFKSLKDAASDSSEVAAISERLRPETRDHIFVADLKKSGVKNIGRLGKRGYSVSETIPSLYVNGESQTVARWPNDGEECLKFGAKVEQNTEFAESSTFRYDYDRPQDWSLENDGKDADVWAFGLYQYEWAGDLRRVLAIDRDKKTITFDAKDGSGRFDYYFVNILEELDLPGEYYVDAESGLLYLYPPQGLESADALRDALVEYDEFDKPFVVLKNVRNVLFSGLTFRSGRATAVYFEECDGCYFADGQILGFGYDAVVLRRGQYCGVLNTRLHELGSNGVSASGGNRETLTPCCHIVHNCFISDFARIDRVYAPALSFDGCGCVATNNLFCDSPHHAFRTDGNDIYIARNEVHSVVYEFSDQAGVDIYCDPSYRGIVIEDNLWRHIGSAFALCGQAGIRLDDSISGVVMKGNIFYRSSGGRFGGIQIHGGKDNLAIDNVFVDCKYAFSFNYWQPERYERFVKEQFSQNVNNPKYLETYPFFDEIFDHYNRNYVIDNKAIGCGAFLFCGDTNNLYLGNSCKDIDESSKADDSLLDDPQGMRNWIEKISGRSLENIGLKANWNGANEPVSKKFITR